MEACLDDRLVQSLEKFLEGIERGDSLNSIVLNMWWWTLLRKERDTRDQRYSE